MLKFTILAAAAVAVMFCSLLVSAAVELQSSNNSPHMTPAQWEQYKTAKKRQHVGAWPSTVSSLNVSQYLGQWFNVYANALVLDTFQNHSTCAVAVYGIEANSNKISVLNWERQYTITGNSRNITGYATQPHPQEYPGRLEVRLFATNANPFPAPYWVFALGPVVDNKYQWAIVSDMLKLTLFVLTRDVDRFDRVYKTDVMKVLEERGFKGLDAPIQIPQGAACNYPKF